MPLQFRRFRSLAVLLAAFVAAAALTGIGEARAQDKADEEKPYTVKDGKVDRGTYNGYRRYGNSCLSCHGPDGLGSSYAPNLLDSLKVMSVEDFKEVVVNGRENVTQAQQNVMPSFGLVEDVMLYLDDIYAYLKARSDGALGRGRPERFKE
jgi:methanol metabolism-related c-type cytochrome